VRKKRGYVLVAGTDVPALVHTTRIADWLEAGIMVWEDKIDIEELIQFLSTYLIVESPTSSGAEEPEPSGLILPAGIQTP